MSFKSKGSVWRSGEEGDKRWGNTLLAESSAKVHHRPYVQKPSFDTVASRQSLFPLSSSAKKGSSSNLCYPPSTCLVLPVSGGNHGTRYRHPHANHSRSAKKMDSICQRFPLSLKEHSSTCCQKRGMRHMIFARSLRDLIEVIKYIHYRDH